MPWIGPVVGGVISYMGAQDAADSYSSAANRAAGATAFKPYNVYSGYGSGTFSPGSAGTRGYWSGGTPSYSGSEHAAGGGGGMGGFLGIGRPNAGGARTWIPGTAASGPSATASLNPQYQGLRDEYLQQAYGYNGALTNYDPQSSAADLYAKLQAISAPQRQSDRNAFETRQLAQGQMGLQQGGVNPALQSFLSAQNQADLQREISAFGMSQDVQDRLQNRSLAATTAATGLDALPLQNLSLGGVFGGRGAQAAQFGANLQNNAAMRQGDATAQLWSSIGQQVGPAVGSYFNQPNYGSYNNNGFNASQYWSGGEAAGGPNAYSGAWS